MEFGEVIEIDEDSTAKLEKMVAKAKAEEQDKALDNAKRERFCQEYVVDCNGTQAAIRAGYSPKTAQQISTTLLSKVVIQERVAELQRRIAWETELTAKYVLTGLMDVHERCVGDDDFNAAGANRALELLGKHLKLFTDKTELEAGKTLASALAKLLGSGEADEADEP